MPDKKTNYEVIQIPNEVTTTYQGSNAEYIVFKAGADELSEQEYLTSAIPILRLQFPRTREVESTLSPDDLEKLNCDEVNYLDERLSTHGLSAIKIPKALYDIFYIAFRFDTSVPKQEDLCQFTQSLERFYRPSAQIDRYKQNLCFQEETIDQRFITIDKDQVVSKVDFELNQYILRDLRQKGIENKELHWKEIVPIVEKLWKRINEINKINEQAIDSLYNGNCLLENCTQYHSNHSVFRMVRNFQRTDHLTIIMRAIYQEYSQKASIYTLYRGGNLSTDIKQPGEHDDNIHSISYGQSLCSSCELDMGGGGAIPFEFMREYGHGYSLMIDKNEYQQGVTKNLFIIPPAQRTARFRLNGEFTHARSRVYPTSNTKIHGM